MTPELLRERFQAALRLARSRVDHEREVNRRWVENNREKTREYGRRYRVTHREQERERAAIKSRRRREEYPERVRESQRRAYLRREEPNLQLYVARDFVAWYGGLMTKVYKIELLVIDHDGLGPDEATAVLESQRYPNHCMHPRVLRVSEREVEWDDDHPLNRLDTQDDAGTDRQGPGKAPGARQGTVR